LVPKVARVGDEVCVVLGCGVPVVLREGEGGMYRVVGEAVVDGWMRGEGVKELEGEEEGEGLRTVTLC
jgi:hypothetical protein